MKVDACCLGRFRTTAAVASSTAKRTTAVLSLYRTSVTGLSLPFCHSGCGITAVCRKARLRQTKLAGWRSNHALAGQNEKISDISRDSGPGCSGVDDKPAWRLTTLADAPTLHVARSWPFMTHRAHPILLGARLCGMCCPHAGGERVTTCGRGQSKGRGPVRIRERHIAARRTVRLGGQFFARPRKLSGIRAVECWPPACPSVLA
jgi:hypothetical protein